MKKIIVLLLVLLLTLTACAKTEPTQQQEPVFDLPDIGTAEAEPEDTSEPEPEAAPAPVDEQEPLPEEFTLIPQRNRICAGAYMSAALKNDGTVLSNWDDIPEREKAGYVPWQSWENIVDLSLYSETMLGLKEDGSVVWCGGRTDESWWDSEVMDEVANWHDVAQVSAGIFDLAALCSDGTLLLAGTLRAEALTERSGFTQVSMGDALLALRHNGTVFCYFPYEDNPYDVSSWENIKQISAGWDHAVGLRADGTVAATGKNDFGQCDVGDWTDIVQVCAGRQHTIGLKSDGSVVVTGHDYFKELNITGWTDIVEISSHYNHTIGLKSDGTLVFAGDDNAFLKEASIN